MLEVPRTPARQLAVRRPREIDVNAGPAEEGGHSQPNIFAVVWRRKWIVLFCVLLGIAGSIGYYLQATPIYSSASTIYVQGTALKMVDDPMASAQRSQQFQFTQCQVLTSSALLAEAIKKPEMGRVKMLQGVDNPVGLLKSCLAAAPDKFSDLIFITCESPNPQDAATVANCVVESYVDYQGRQHKSSAYEVLRIFQKERDQHEESLRTTQAAMLKLKKENPDLAFQAANGGNLVSTKLGEFSERLTQAQLRLLDIRTAVAEAGAMKDDPAGLRRLLNEFQVGTEQDATSDPSLMSAYRDARERLNDLLDRLGTRHDLVKLTEKQVGRLETEVQEASRQAAATYLALLQSSQKIAESRVGELQKIMLDARTSAVDLNFKQAEYDQLKKDEDRVTRSIDLLDNRIKELNVNEDVGSVTVNVLETAQPGFLPIRPVRTKTLGMGLVAGLMAGVGLAMLRDLMDQRLRSASEITALLDLPILGVVPHMLGKLKGLEPGRIVELQPRSTVAEAYRTIRTAVTFGAGESVKTLLVTSPMPGDGKSTCASNLALAFAQSGRRTLLIDADCRRPSQDRVHSVTDISAGLSDVLQGKAALQEVIRETTADMLDLLPCGTIPHNPAELLDSQTLLDILGQVSSQYDQIVIDSPPVVPVTDARILGASVDAVVLVLRAERSTRRLAEHARDSMNAVGANMIGVIVNDVPRGSPGLGYDYYTYGSYGYKSLSRSTTNGEHAANGSLAVPGRSIDA
ncbi:MAG: polysaccharide biosynthesis tyrosine autokinase [Tepidisphaeraceae bacterium]